MDLDSDDKAIDNQGVKTTDKDYVIPIYVICVGYYHRLKS